MSQSSLNDEELFGEAAEEMRTDVEEALDAARDELPAADDVWDVEADNTLGVLNALRSALDIEDVESNLRDAKKAFVVGERADAFEDADELKAEIDAVEDVLGDIETAREQVGELASTVPALRSTLEEAPEGSEDGEAEADDGESDEEAEE